MNRLRGWAPGLAWLACLLPAVVSSLSRGLWAPDEPRYAQVAREMFALGDYVVMHLCGDVYPDKPPLLFWLAGVLGRLTDWSVPAMRLVSIAATGVTAYCVSRLASRWWGRAESRWAPVVFLSTVMVLEIGGRLQIDPLLTACCTGALVLVDSPGSARHWWGAGLLTGLGALAKGPVAFVDVGLVLLAWAVIARGTRPRVRVSAWLPALVLAVLPVAAWALAAMVREPELARELLYGQHVDRIVDNQGRHPGPVWKNLVRMPLLLLPWTVPVVAQLWATRGAAARWREGRADRGDRGELRAAAWLAVLFVFFSAIPPKRDLYLLPAYPAAALLAGRWLVVAGRAGRDAVAGWSVVAVMTVAGAALCALPLLPPHATGGVDLGAAPLLSGALLLGGATVVGRRLRAARGWLVPFSASWLAAVTLAFGAVMPAIDEHKSARSLATTVADLDRTPEEIPCIGVAPEAYRFYAGLPTVRARALDAALLRDGDEFLALLERRYWERLPPEQLRSLEVLHEERVGSKDVVVAGRRSARRPRPSSSGSGSPPAGRESTGSAPSR